MIDKKFNLDELFILHVSEIVYYVPCDVDGAYMDTFYAQDYFTIASSKDNKKFRDVFKPRRYTIDGYVGLGVMRDIKEILPLKSYDSNLTKSISRRELAPIIETFVEELRNSAIEEEKNEEKRLAL